MEIEQAFTEWFEKNIISLKSKLLDKSKVSDALLKEEAQSKLVLIILNYFLVMAINLFESFIAYDDKKLIKTIKNCFNYYSQFSRLRFKSLFLKWKYLSKSNTKFENTEHEYTKVNKNEKNKDKETKIKTSKAVDTKINKSNMKQTKAKTTKFTNNRSNIIYTNEVKENKSDGGEMQEQEELLYHYDSSFPGLSLKQREENYSSAKSEIDVFNRLYLDSFNKQDNIQYNTDIRHVKENHKYIK